MTITMRTLAAAVQAGLLAVALSGTACGGGEESAAPAPPAGPAANMAGPGPQPVAPDPAAGAGAAGSHAPLEEAELARAAQLFKANCAVCHTESGKGDPHHKRDGIPDFTSAAWHEGETDAELTASITNGHGKVMPPFRDRLSDEEIRLLVHYIHGFPERAGADRAASPRRGEKSRTAPRPKAAPTAKGSDEHAGHGGHPDR
jgi:mono/diheme cytochrome c family protein